MVPNLQSKGKLKFSGPYRQISSAWAVPCPSAWSLENWPLNENNFQKPARMTGN